MDIHLNQELLVDEYVIYGFLFNDSFGLKLIYSVI